MKYITFFPFYTEENSGSKEVKQQQQQKLDEGRRFSKWQNGKSKSIRPFLL